MFTRIYIRQLLDKLLRNDADLRGFCLDHFPHIAKRFTSSMEFKSMINLLLELADPDEIFEALKIDPEFSIKLRKHLEIAPNGTLQNSVETNFFETEKRSTPGDSDPFEDKPEPGSQRFSPKSVEPEEFEGLWTGRNETTYCFQYIKGEMRIAYCYRGTGQLTGHIFDCRMDNEHIYGRFEWIDKQRSGYHYFRLINYGILIGGWCYEYEVVKASKDFVLNLIPLLHTSVMKPILARKASSEAGYPEWATQYFSAIH